MGWIGRLLGIARHRERRGGGLGVDELAERLGLTIAELNATRAEYHEFHVPKRRGGTRRIDAPSPELKRVQRLVLRRVLGRLSAHPAAVGFERGHSIVSHASYHTRRAVVVNLDIRDFFGSTSEARVRAYFRRIGWNKAAADLLTRLCVHRGGLPQGAPTSPRLSNLANYGMDVRLARVAERNGARYSRYADDLTFSFDAASGALIGSLRYEVRCCLEDFGYRLNGKKLRVRRRTHQRQRVAGLVVNEGVRLPRDVRRRLRAIEHRLATGRPATLNEAQMAGWASFRSMVETQAASLDGGG